MVNLADTEYQPADPPFAVGLIHDALNCRSDDTMAVLDLVGEMGAEEIQLGLEPAVLETVSEGLGDLGFGVDEAALLDRLPVGWVYGAGREEGGSSEG